MIRGNDRSVQSIVNAYLDGKDLIALHRDEEGHLKRQVLSPEHVIYLLAADVDRDFTRQISQSRWTTSFKVEGSWLRVGFPDRFIREDMIFGRRGHDAKPSPFAERGIKVYEGDVHPVRRWLTDTNVTIQRPRRCYFDIETDSRVAFSKKETARVLAWAIVGSAGDQWSGVLENDSDEAERSLLENMWTRFTQFDQVLAWNGDGFDFPVIQARTEKFSIRVNPQRWLWLDHLALFKRMNMHAAESGDEKQSMKLQSIAMAILGEGKDDFDASKTWEVWKDGDRNQLSQYNIKDTDLLRRIEDKTGFASLLDTIAEVCRVFPESRALQPTVQMDGYMLRLGLENNLHFPTKRYREEPEKYRGAFVMEPRAKGIEYDVHVCDFASLYPSIILTWNMSSETKADIPPNGPVLPGHCRSSTGQGFRVDQPGLLTNALRDALAQRVVWKEKKASLPPGTPAWVDADRLSTAFKVFANAFYGVIGSAFSRFYEPRIAEAITQAGRWLLEYVIHEAELRGMRGLYADTDSLYVQNATATEFEEFVRWCNSDLFPKLVAAQGCVENHIKLAYEKQFSRIVFVSAKRYAGAYLHYAGKAATKDSKPEVKGLEFKRGDTAMLARKLQERVIHQIIVEGDTNPQSCRTMIDQMQKYVLNDPLPIEEVQLSKSVSKPLNQYVAKKKADGEDAANPPHVRVARVLQARGQEVTEGTRIAYVVLDGDGGINAPIPAEDYQGELDRYYLWEKLVYPPTQRFVQAAFPEIDWVTNLERVRPPKSRRRSSRVSSDQLGLSLGQGAQDFVFVVEERFGRCIEKLATACKAHPGMRPLIIHIQLASGAVAVVASKTKVSGTSSLTSDLTAVLWDEAAIVAWEDACVN